MDLETPLCIKSENIFGNKPTHGILMVVFLKESQPAVVTAMVSWFILKKNKNTVEQCSPFGPKENQVRKTNCA